MLVILGNFVKVLAVDFVPPDCRRGHGENKDEHVQRQSVLGVGLVIRSEGGNLGRVDLVDRRHEGADQVSGMPADACQGEDARRKEGLGEDGRIVEV